MLEFGMERKGQERVPVEASENQIIYLEKDENVIALCTNRNCHAVIFKGSDLGQIERRVLRERVVDHMTSFEERHEVDIIYPRNNSDQRIVYWEDYDSMLGIVNMDKIRGRLI